MRKRQKFYDAVDELSKKCFVPLTVGGWIQDTDDVFCLLGLGADKIIINTEAYRNLSLISNCAKIFGRQCVVVSIDVRKHGAGHYEVYIDRGMEATGEEPEAWLKGLNRWARERFVSIVLRGMDLGRDMTWICYAM